MVFAVRCPNPRCRKYLLVEDHDRGRTIPCLICKQPIPIPAAPRPGAERGSGGRTNSP